MGRGPKFGPKRFALCPHDVLLSGCAICAAHPQPGPPPKVVEAPKRVKVGLWLPEKVYRAMQHTAIDKDCSVGELVEQLWVAATNA